MLPLFCNSNSIYIQENKFLFFFRRGVLLVLPRYPARKLLIYIDKKGNTKVTLFRLEVLPLFGFML